MRYGKIGFGCWQLGGEQTINGMQNGWRVGPETQRIKLIEDAITSGIDVFDTAQAYGDGISETLLGTAVSRSGQRNDLLIVTKLSHLNTLAPDEINWSTFLSCLDDSRRRLQMDVIDVVLLHGPSLEMLSDQIQTLFERAREEGYINSYGVSPRGWEDLQHATDIGFGTYLQWNYSALERRCDEQFLSKLRRRGQNFIGRSTLFRGLITETFFRDGPACPFYDARDQLPQVLLTEIHEKISALRPVAQALDLTLSELAIGATLLNELSLCSLVGISKPEHLTSIIKVRDLPQTKLDEIKSALEAL
ncbi:Aldo/keto reductase [Tritonibacter mobilis]|uniref:aldo/keto reductase n=1 Tax=Tritonibacter mobilis TaxID=379347 RepID=UPI000F70C981|nr:aldo/keto reductase [Tritonibacter mobilis]VCU57457.1 Aldo/keto reductase [Tritonibacter mobilis]